MPFIVTTSRPAAYRSIGPPTIYRISRQAVATLEEAQRVLRAAVRDADWPRDIGGSNARQSVSGQIDDLMASGGNAIRLPDGTLIEVMAVDDEEYARAFDAGMNGPAVPGVAEGRPVRSELERIERLLAEFGDVHRPASPYTIARRDLLDEALALVRGLRAALEPPA